MAARGQGGGAKGVVIESENIRVSVYDTGEAVLCYEGVEMRR